MKIIDTDNFGGDYPNETIIAENIRSADLAEVMCTALNYENSIVYGDNAPRYYVVVADDYVLRPGFKP